MNINKILLPSKKFLAVALVASTSFLVSNYAMAKNTIIVLKPFADPGAQQDIYKSESINRFDSEKVISTVSTSLKEALLKSNKFDIKLVRDSELEKAIRQELASSDSEEATNSVNYMIKQKARFLVQASLTAVDAGRSVTRLSKNVYTYQDSGSISLNLAIIDTGANDKNGANAGNQVFSENVNVTYSTPYRRLRSNDTKHVNSRFWNEIIAKATRKMTSKIINKQEQLYVLSSNSANNIIKLNKGKLTGNIQLNDQFHIVNQEGNSIAVARVTQVNDTSATAKIVTTKARIKNGYFLQKMERENTDDGSLF